METNPYRPPLSNVDVLAPRRADRPPAVTHALWLVWLTFPLGLPSAVHALQTDPTLLSAFLAAASYVLWIALLVSLGRGRNWARVGLAWLTALLGVSAVTPLDVPYPTILRALDSLAIAMHVIAAWLLFTKLQ